MAGALACLAVGLAAILEMAQQKAHQLLADFDAAAIQGLGNVPLAAAGPASCRSRIAASRILDYSFTRRKQTRLRLDRRLPSPSRTPDATIALPASRFQLR